MARQTHGMESHFRSSGKELDGTDAPLPVQTSAELARQFTVVHRKSFCCQDVPRSNPVAFSRQTCTLKEAACSARFFRRELQLAPECQTDASYQESNIKSFVDLNLCLESASGRCTSQRACGRCRRLPITNVRLGQIARPDYSFATVTIGATKCTGKVTLAGSLSCVCRPRISSK